MGQALKSRGGEIERLIVGRGGETGGGEGAARAIGHLARGGIAQEKP